MLDLIISVFVIAFLFSVSPMVIGCIFIVGIALWIVMQADKIRQEREKK